MERPGAVRPVGPTLGRTEVSPGPTQGHVSTAVADVGVPYFQEGKGVALEFWCVLRPGVGSVTVPSVARAELSFSVCLRWVPQMEQKCQISRNI